MQIPRYLMQHTLVVEPAIGNSSHGPEFGPPVAYQAFIDDATQLVRDQNGIEVVSSSRALVDLTAVIPIESRVSTVFMPRLIFMSLDAEGQTRAKTRESLVLNVLRRDGGNLPVPSHFEVILK